MVTSIRLARWLLSFLVIFMAPALVLAQGAPLPNDSDAPPSYSDAATGDWMGVRPTLARDGFAFDAGLTTDGFANLRGGLARGGTLLYNLDVTLSIDAERTLGWHGASLFAYVLGNYGGSPTDYVGDFQVVSNIDAPSAVRLYELWLEQQALDGRLSVRAGLYDLNSEFYVTESSGVFINSSMGIGPEMSSTGVNGPSIFPVTSLAARVRVVPAGGYYLQAAAFDAVPGDPDNPDATAIILRRDEGALLAVEAGRSAGDPADAGYRKVAVGGWAYTRSDAALTGNRRGRTLGAYALAEGRMFSERGNDGEGLDAFARLGWSRARTNALTLGWEAGLTYTGLLPGRPGDTSGLALAAAHYGAPYLRAQRRAATPADDAELVLELTHRAVLARGVSLQPDLQYVINPGMRPGSPNALVFGVRVDVTL